MIGQIVDGLEVIGRVGVGGMGEVYLARAPDGAERALKVVRTDRDASPQAVARFRREVLALRKLRHPGIVQMVDAGRLETGALYLAMEYVRGPDLQHVIADGGPLAPRDGVTLLAQLASALASAHGVGIVHRDLKPQNVLLAGGDPASPKIIDFGLAKLCAEENLTRLTDDQDIVGSPLYWAPEQSSSAAVGPAADVYALGGIAYLVLSGEPMFRPRPAVAMVYAHLNEPPPSLADRCMDLELPDGVIEVVHACVTKDPARRPNAAQVAAELEELVAAAPAGPRRRRVPRLFTATGLPNFEQALAAQIRQVLIELATIQGRTVDDLDRWQAELSELELDLAMLDAELAAGDDPELVRRRASVGAAVAALHDLVAEAFRSLFDALVAERATAGAAGADCASLYAELDELLERSRKLR